ncbi:MAG: flagellar biosynthesis protein FliQ [Deltaproteobacteria bacterium]|nr:flagellar biosynthesis protein FliQ [Deltaproteobacteria bacterium]
MTPEFIVGFASETIKVVLLVSAPMLGLGLAVGLIISIFQSVTQIQEMTLTFVPKIVVVMLALLFFAPWMMETLLDFTRKILQGFPMYVR